MKISIYARILWRRRVKSICENSKPDNMPED
jgi:hypothetical protein